MANYSRRELKRALRTKIVAHDMPKWVHDEIDRQRKKMNREALTIKEEMDLFIREEMQLKKARPFIPSDSLRGRLIVGLKNRLNRTPAWAIKVQEFLKDWLWSD